MEEYTVVLDGEEAMALGSALDWLQENYGLIYDPTLSRIKKKLSKAVKGY